MARAARRMASLRTRRGGLEHVQVHHVVEFNFAVDNLNNKRYYETQNYVTSRLPGEPVDGIPNIHGTPGSPVGFTGGFTFRWKEK